MSSYHTSFNYLGKNSITDYSLLIASFDGDSGENDSFLGMDQVYTESYDGTRRNLYGLKYNSVASVKITLVKPDGSDFSVAENRKILKWLTGHRQASWLDLYEGETLAYSFWGSVTNVQQQKMDARIVGIILTFESTTPWAYSAPQKYDCRFGEDNLMLNDAGLIYKGVDDSLEAAMLGIDANGVVFNDNDDETVTFNITPYGVVYNSDDIILQIDNQSDDLYTYINLDMTYENIAGNETGNTLTIVNLTLGETTSINDISQNEIVTLSAGQFITSETFPNKIFGDNFNFIWPRLGPGINEFKINGSGRGRIEFTYRHPMKIGDCAVDINNLINNPICSGYVPSTPGGGSSGSGGGSGSSTGGSVENAVLYTAQNLTNLQKEQARTNIGAGTSSFSGSYNDLTNLPQFSDVAYSGDYNDLINLPSIAEPTEVIDSLTSDSVTSALSANQGKVLDNKITALSNAMGDAGYGDMLKATYDTDGSGVVDDSEKLGGQLPSYYATASDLQTAIDNIPSALKNPYQIIFTGAVSGSYDGSAEVTIDIPVTSNSLSMRVSDGYLQYLNTDDSTWINLIKTSELVSMNMDKDGVVYLG